MAKYPTFPDCLDEVKQLDIGFLRKHGYLKPSSLTKGTINWRQDGERTGSIGITANTFECFVEFSYLIDGVRINYRVMLVSVPSNLGIGRVWYFTCPATGKRCRKLYLLGRQFLSRFAYPNAVYSCQIESKRFRGFRSVFGVADKISDFLEQPYSKPYYNGTPTRRFQRLLDREKRTYRRGGTLR